MIEMLATSPPSRPMSRRWGLGSTSDRFVRLFFADIGVGLLYWLAERSGQGIGDMTTRTFDYGTTFLWVAGLLNYLIVLDAYDIARGRKP